MTQIYRLGGGNPAPGMAVSWSRGGSGSQHVSHKARAVSAGRSVAWLHGDGVSAPGTGGWSEVCGKERGQTGITKGELR